MIVGIIALTPALVDLPDAQDATKMSVAALSAAQLHVPTSQCSCHRPPCHTSSIHDPHAETCWHHVEGARMWARSHSDGLYHRDAPDIELQENLISLSVTSSRPLSQRSPDATSPRRVSPSSA